MPKIDIDMKEWEAASQRILNAVAGAEDKEITRQVVFIKEYVSCALSAVEKELNQRDERLRKMAQRVRELERQMGVNHEAS